MNNKLEVIKDKIGVSYTWIDETGRGATEQRIYLEPTLAKNRGNFRSVFDVIHRLEKLKSILSSYYFDEAIADQELRYWAFLIRSTINDELLGVQTSNNFIVEENDYFKLTKGEVTLHFKTISPVKLFYFDVASKDELFVLDAPDFLPRYYFAPELLERELRAWIEVRKQDSLFKEEV